VPKTVEVRAESIDSAFPTRMRRPILRFQLEDGAEIDLTAAGKAFQFVSRCPECPLDMVIAHIDFDVLRQIAKSSALSIDALGFAARLKPADLESLRKFVAVVSQGLRIQ